MELRHGYLAGVSYLDANIGRVLAELDRLGLRESLRLPASNRTGEGLSLE